MPMPELDPTRFYAAVLADPSHTLPLPKELGGRNFFAEGEVVDSANPFFAAVLADGSLKRKPIEAPVPDKPDEPMPDEQKPADAPKAVDPAPKPASPAPAAKAATAS